MDVQPCLFLWAKAHRMHFYADLIPQLQAVVVSGVFHSADVGLLGCKASLTG